MLKRGLVFNLTSDSDTIKDYKSANVLITQSRKHSTEGGLSPTEDAVTPNIRSQRRVSPGHKAEIFLREFCFQKSGAPRYKT